MLSNPTYVWDLKQQKVLIDTKTRGGWGVRKWVQGVRRYKLPVLNKSWGCDVQNCILRVAKPVDLKSSLRHKEKKV